MQVKRRNRKFHATQTKKRQYNALETGTSCCVLKGFFWLIVTRRRKLIWEWVGVRIRLSSMKIYGLTREAAFSINQLRRRLLRRSWRCDDVAITTGEGEGMRMEMWEGMDTHQRNQECHTPLPWYQTLPSSRDRSRWSLSWNPQLDCSRGDSRAAKTS